MLTLIILLPLIGAFFSGFFGRKIGVIGSQVITSICLILTTMFATIYFFEVGVENTPVSIELFRWIDSESLNVLWSFQFDSLTISMLIPVLIISCLVHIYSIGYMSQDPHNQRFFSYLSLFTFMMIILVTANNFLLMFVGWEGVGICSYLLVSFWYTRIAANQSSMSAFLTNRVGDCFLTIGMFAILWSFGNVDYSTVFSLAPYINENIVTIIGICLLIGAMAKSSQVGLHVWLPMAMEGPTPVSALIHAATMVTAGVYLLMRTSPLIEYSSTVLILCLWTGAMTTVFSSLIGLFQQDIKKVIAYSTMSQLGMMVIAVGLSSYNIALFHLINHAFYKGLLFLGAGAVIHAVADNQDFRKYGGLKPFLPLTYSVILIASLSLVAFPFMTGFYSKDLILESAYGQFYFSSYVVYVIATVGAIFTTLYSVKVIYLTFLTNPNGPFVNYKQAHEGDIFMSLPLIILAIFSIFFGYITKDIFIGLGSGFFSDNSLFIHPSHEIMLDTEFGLATIFKLLPLIFTVSFSILAILLPEFLPKLIIQFKVSFIGYNIFSFFNQRFFIELLYNKYISGIILKLGGQTVKILDKGSVELIGPYGFEKGFILLSKNIARLDTGLITSYALYILVAFVFYVIILFLAMIDNSIIILGLFALHVLINRSNSSVIDSLGLSRQNKLLSYSNLSNYRQYNSSYSSLNYTQIRKFSSSSRNLMDEDNNSSSDIKSSKELETLKLRNEDYAPTLEEIKAQGLVVDNVAYDYNKPVVLFDSINKFVENPSKSEGIDIVEKTKEVVSDSTNVGDQLEKIREKANYYHCRAGDKQNTLTPDPYSPLPESGSDPVSPPVGSAPLSPESMSESGSTKTLPSYSPSEYEFDSQAQPTQMSSEVGVETAPVSAPGPESASGPSPSLFSDLTASSGTVIRTAPVSAPAPASAPVSAPASAPIQEVDDTISVGTKRKLSDLSDISDRESKRKLSDLSDTDPSAEQSPPKAVSDLPNTDPSAEQSSTEAVRLSYEERLNNLKLEEDKLGTIMENIDTALDGLKATAEWAAGAGEAVTQTIINFFS